jgi:hypothetical protein
MLKIALDKFVPEQAKAKKVPIKTKSTVKANEAEYDELTNGH